MTPDQIIQIRQSVAKIRKCYDNLDDDLYDELDKILALLPCPTCNGTKKTNRFCVDIDGIEFIAEKNVPCPDCK